MGQISDAIAREYNSALERHQDSFSVGLKKVVDTFEKNKYVQISPENDPERRALTEAEEIAILRNEITRFLRSATGLASAGFAQRAENERAVVDFLMALIPKGLIKELMSEHLEWESKIRSVSKNHRATPGPRKIPEKKTSTDSDDIASRLGVKIWKTVNGTFQLVAADVLDDDRWLFKIDAATDSAIDTGIRTLGLSNFQGRCTWGSNHIFSGIYAPVLIACFGNKDKALVVILHWKDFWSHDMAVNALSPHLSAQKRHSAELLFMPSILIWDGGAGLQPMGYQFGRSINPSYGLMPIYDSIMGRVTVGRPVVSLKNRNARNGMIRIGQFQPDFFSSDLEGGWFNE